MAQKKPLSRETFYRELDLMREALQQTAPYSAGQEVIGPLLRGLNWAYSKDVVRNNPLLTAPASALGFGSYPDAGFIGPPEASGAKPPAATIAEALQGQLGASGLPQAAPAPAPASTGRSLFSVPAPDFSSYPQVQLPGVSGAQARFPQPTPLPLPERTAESEFAPILEELQKTKPQQKPSGINVLQQALGGAAAGARGAENIGDLLLGAGAGAVGGLDAARLEQKRDDERFEERSQQFSQSLANVYASRAQAKMAESRGIEEVQRGNVSAQNETARAQAQAQFQADLSIAERNAAVALQQASFNHERDKAIWAAKQPKITTSKTGITFQSYNQEDGTYKVEVVRFDTMKEILDKFSALNKQADLAIKDETLRHLQGTEAVIAGRKLIVERLPEVARAPAQAYIAVMGTGMYPQEKAELTEIGEAKFLESSGVLGSQSLYFTNEEGNIDIDPEMLKKAKRLYLMGDLTGAKEQKMRDAVKAGAWEDVTRIFEKK